MMTTKLMSATVNNDAELVSGTLSGDRDAFSQIVSRYQSLICSLAYSATGSLGQSEDLAQETFITAWKHLGHLRERDKLRAWLCGIARNRINNFLRREGREPIRAAEPLENVPEAHAAEPLPGDQTISNEEQAILWRSLVKIPEIYREPLVLFYREHQSVEAVAEKLELTEDAVKQRLSRGRKLLHEQVLAFVEGALERTNPGKTFTLGVLAALPALTLSAKAATIGAAAAKGSVAAKSAAASGLFAALFTPLIVVFGNYAGYRVSLDSARSDEERRHIKIAYKRILQLGFAFVALFAAIVFWACQNQKNHPALVRQTLQLLFNGMTVVYLTCVAVFAAKSRRQRRERLRGIMTREHLTAFPQPAWEYRSRSQFLGMPLVHICVGDHFAALKQPVKAWFAAGEFAYGGIFAFGGLAIAPISIGGVALGVLPFGGLAGGIFALGGFAAGIWATGGTSIGWQAFGGCAMAWNAAAGGVALAHDFAVGGLAQAAQANTEAARQLIASQPFFTCAKRVCDHSILLNLLWAVPLIFWWRTVRRARKNVN